METWFGKLLVAIMGVCLVAAVFCALGALVTILEGLFS